MWSVHPLTPDRFPDLERLFGAHGACGGCWCMWFRLPRRVYEAGRGDANRRALQELASNGRPPGLVGYVEDEPVAWCSIAPRTEFRRLESARTLRPADDLPAWTIICLFIARSHRRQRISVAMIRAACAFARDAGATLVEAYPITPKTADVPPVFASHGILAAYLDAGFHHVGELSSGHTLVRWCPSCS